MNITTLKFRKLLEWFNSSEFQYLMIFIGGYEDLDKDIVQHYLDKRVLIDRQTGNSICFIHFLDNIPIMAHGNTSRKDLIFHILSDTGKNIGYKEFGYTGLIATYQACEDICSYYFIPKHLLPAIILIPKQKGRDYSIFPIKSVSDFDSFMRPIKLMNDFIDEITIPKVQGKTSEDLSHALNEINSCIIFWENYRYETYVKQYEQVCKEISCQLERLGILVTQCFSPTYLKRILKKYNIPNSFFREHNKLYSALKKNYKRTIHGPVPDEERLNKILTLKAKYNQYIEMRKDISYVELQIKCKQQKLPETCELYKKRFEELLLIPDASDIVESLFNHQIVMPKVFDMIINRYIQRSAVIKTLVDDITTKVHNRDFKVFISCKSEDYEYGEEVYAYLKSKGLSPFLASKSLREIGGDKYGEVISEVIDSCEHMIVFATMVEYIWTPYVKAEWSMFCNEVKAGRKYGKLLSVVSESIDITGKEFPIDLRNREVFFISKYKDKLYDYLKN